MAAIGQVALGAVPRVVLAVSGDEPSLHAAIGQGVDLLEFRVDQASATDLESVARQAQALRGYGLPLIGTVRTQAEGGRLALSDEQRLALFQRLAPLVDAVDIELQAAAIRLRVIALAKQQRRTVIVSSHIFSGTPSAEELAALRRQSIDAGADIVKLATFAHQPEDVWRLLDFTRAHRDPPLITMAIGPAGSITRVVTPLAGSVLTYTSLAPTLGQWPLPDLVRAIRLCYPARPAL